MIDGVKVFSATKARDREELSSKVSSWLRAIADSLTIVDKWVVQSSDSEFHCLSFVFAYKKRKSA